MTQPIDMTCPRCGQPNVNQFRGGGEPHATERECIEALKSRVSELKEQRFNLESRVNLLASEKSLRDEWLEKAQKAQATLKGQKEKLYDVINRLRTEGDEKDAEIAGLTVKLIAAERETVSVREDLIKRTEQLEKDATDLITIGQDIIQRGRIIGNQQDEIEGLKNQLSAAMLTVEKFAERHTAQRAEIERLTAEITNLKT